MDQEWLERFRENLNSGKKGVKMHAGTDLQLASHIPFGIPTRIPQLDLAIGRPGWPAGRIIEVSGFEHTGKTCVASAAAASAQRKGGVVMWYDTERNFDPAWAETNGVDSTAITIGHPETIEETFEAIDMNLEAVKQFEVTGPVLYVVDSVTAVPSNETRDRDYSAVQRVGADARAIRNCMRKLITKISEVKATVIFINHSVATINAMPFAPQSTSSGGHAIKYNAGLRINMSRIKTLQEKEDDDKVYKGMEVGITVEKNRIGRTSTRRISCFLLENGFDLYENLFDGFQRIDVLKKVNNRTYLFEPSGTQLGRNEWRTYVDEHTKGGLEAAYEWFLRIAAEKGEITNYGGEVHRP